MRDIYNYEGKYSNQLKKIKTYYPLKRKAFENFNNFMITRDLSIARKITLINNLNSFITPTVLKSNTRTTIFKTVSEINKMQKAPNTLRDYKLAYKSYLHSIGTDKDLIELIKVGNPTVRVPKIILDKPLWQHMRTLDEKVFVSLAQETGARPGELMTFKWNNIEYTDFGANITITGKTGTRTIPIVQTVKLLMQLHKTARPDEEYVFWFGYDYIKYKVAEMLKKQGYEQTFLYIFRKSKATQLFEIWPEQLVKKYMGWTKNSKMANVYSFPRQDKLTDAVIEMNTAIGQPKKLQTNLNNWGA